MGDVIHLLLESCFVSTIIIFKDAARKFDNTEIDVFGKKIIILDSTESHLKQNRHQKPLITRSWRLEISRTHHL